MRTKFWLKSVKGRDHSKDLHPDGRIILKFIFGKQGGCGLDTSDSG
jgi:hypothetical protein